MFQFERVVCVSLARRAGRWKEFQARVPDDWPFREIENFKAVDGKKCPAPNWWRPGNGAWGCYKSHLNILEQCLQDDVDSCLFLEDDAVFCDDFREKVRTFFDKLPDDWRMVYLGGQHLQAEMFPPVQVNAHVYQPFDVNRTHAFAIRGRAMMEVVYKHLNAFKDWRKGNHIDHHLGRLHRQRYYPIYCPSQWLIGQEENYSDISRKYLRRRFYPAANSYDAVAEDYIVVLGLHRSGSSCLAMMLHKLGIHMGKNLVGIEGVRGGGGEAAGLMKICEKAMPFPGRNLKGWTGSVQAALLTWIRESQREAKHYGNPAGGKYPHLCALAGQLESTLQGRMKVIHIDRPLEESIASLVRRDPNREPRELESLQRFLWDCKVAFLKTTQAPVLNVEYDDVLANPREVVGRIVSFLGINPSKAQINHAVAHPRKEHRSVGNASSEGAPTDCSPAVRSNG